MNLCTACNEDFGSIGAFDAHRVGKHAYDWSPEQEDGRRCLDTEELTAMGWAKDSHNRWRRPMRKGAFWDVRKRAVTTKGARGT